MTIVCFAFKNDMDFDKLNDLECRNIFQNQIKHFEKAIYSAIEVKLINTKIKAWSVLRTGKLHFYFYDGFEVMLEAKDVTNLTEAILERFTDSIFFDILEEGENEFISNRPAYKIWSDKYDLYNFFLESKVYTL